MPANRELGVSLVVGAAYGAGQVLGETFGIEEQTIRLETVINAEAAERWPSAS